MGICGGLDGGDFGHQLLIDRLAARSIQDQNVIAAHLGRCQSALGDGQRILARHHRQSGDARLFAQHTQLFHRGRTVDVQRGHQHALFLARLEHQAQLGAGGGLARTLQAHHQDRRGRRTKIERNIVAAQRLHQHVMDDLDDLLAGRDRADDIFANGAGADLFNKVLHHRQRHIGVDQGGAHLGQCGIDIGLAERAAPAKLVEHAAKAGLKRFKQTSTPSTRAAKRRIIQTISPQGAHLRCLGSIPRARRGTGKALGLSGKGRVLGL